MAFGAKGADGDPALQRFNWRTSMDFSKVAASLAVGAVGLFGFVIGCDGGETNGNTTTTGGNEVTCELPAACVAADKMCVAIVDNTGLKQFGLRMSQILINKPLTLGPAKFVGKTVAGGVTWKRPDCYLTGDAEGGTFSWLLHIDLDTNTVCTGGAKPPVKAEDGYTFVNEMLMQAGQTFDIKPIKFTSPELAMGKFSVADGQDIIVPIYTAEGDPILLPLRKARITEATLSPSNNCVGSFNGSGLDPFNNCGPNPAANEFTFNNGGKLEGFITLEDADDIVVDLANASLCALLTEDGDGAMPTSKCKRDAMGMVTYKGDWCAATNAAATADCADAVQLAADFAASAVKINGGCPIP
jgi:hypothetical protein